MKTHKLLQAFLIAGLLSFSSLELIAFTTKPKSVAKLNSVFTNEVNARSKEIIKLYDDLSYEFLFFEFYNKKPRVKREKGTYSLKKQKLTLKNSGKSQPKEHSERFIIKENDGLFACNRFGKIDNSSQSSYVDNKDRKYWQATYIDSVFGEITNDRKATRKIIEVKPVYVPVSPKVLEPAESLDKTVVTDRTLLSRDSLKILKAIIVVGPVEESTKSFIDEQKAVAQYLKSIGVQVVEFYHPNAKWKDIVKASEDANIFIYAGHGRVSVFCLTDQTVEAETITKDLKLHKNALVIFNHACESAGASAPDTKDIGQAEAIRRVSDYAKTFVGLNASAYYANNYDGSVIPFLTSFFQRQTFSKIYKTEASKWTKIEVLRKYSYDSNFEIGLACSKPSNEMQTLTWYTNGKISKVEKFKDFKMYEVAFVAKPNYTVNDLFK